MKKLILILALLLISTYLYSAPPDSCLWLATPITINETFDDEDKHNQDSTLYLDTCDLWLIEPGIYNDSLDNPTQFPKLSPEYNILYKQYKKFYSKRIWGLNFYTTSFAFDTVGKELNILKFFTVNDLDSANVDIYEGFKTAESIYGEIRFRFSTNRNLSIKEAMDNTFNKNYCYVETVNLVNSIEFAEFFNNIPNLHCVFNSEMVYPISSVNDSETQNQFLVFPNPVSDFLVVLGLDESQVQSISIFNTFGQKLYEGDLKEQIDVSSLTPGVYFLHIGNMNYKFVKL
jgi:hypothetical protein